MFPETVDAGDQAGPKAYSQAAKAKHASLLKDKGRAPQPSTVARFLASGSSSIDLSDIDTASTRRTVSAKRRIDQKGIPR
jgi:hypothetical protein